MKFQEKVTRATILIRELYLNDKRPWVVGYSGGKDSTTVLQLIFRALLDLPKDLCKKSVFVISSDTLVETPLIIDYIDKNLRLIEDSAKRHDLPITTHKVKPNWEDTFWVNLIGKGYPTPRQKFRWCTDRLKIKPANQFVRDRVSEFGEVTMVLGVRRDESASRGQVMQKYKVEGRVLRRHTSLPNAYVFAPIEEFSADDVWAYLMTVDSPWGSDNAELFKLYQDSSDGECPLVVDKNTPSCGNSRFGCWVCTVVQEDKAVKGFIESGEDWLRPLLQYRNWLCEIRDNEDYRLKRRMNGSVYYVGSGDSRRIGLGPFTLDARKEMLEKLLEAQSIIRKNGHELQLIRFEELRLIRALWLQEGDWADSLPKICSSYLGEKVDWRFDERPFYIDQDLKLLNSLCESHGVEPELVKRLVQLELDNYGYKYRHNIFKDIGRLLSQDWLHESLDN